MGCTTGIAFVVCVEEFVDICKRLLAKFRTFSIPEFEGFWGHDLCACGVDYILDHDEALGEEGLEEF